MKTMKKVLIYLLVACMLVPNLPAQAVEAKEETESTAVVENSGVNANTTEQKQITDKVEASTVDTGVNASVVRVECKSVTFIENTNGYLQLANNDSWWYYNQFPYYTVEMSDGTVYRDLNYGGFSHNGQFINAYVTTDQSYENQWGVGEHTATLYVDDKQVDFTITIVENPIENVSIDPVTIVEGTYGNMVSSMDSQNHYVEFYKYDLWRVLPNVEITLKNGSKLPNQYGSFTYMGMYYSAASIDTQSYENQWSVGTYTAEIQILGVNYSYDVSIVESPYTEIEVINIAPVVENQYGEYDGENFIYNIPDFTYRLKGANGEQLVQYFTEDWLKMTNSKDSIQVTVASDQEENPWKPGQDNYFTITYLDLELKVKVEVQAESPYEYYVDGGQVFITGCYDYSKDLVIPSILDNYPVVGLLDLGEAWRTAETVTIPDSVTVIAESAFSNCYFKLRSVTIGSGVKYLSLDMFAHCYDLESITVSENNANYSSIDGVLYNKDGTTFIAYPQAKGEMYEIPATVTNVDAMFVPAYDSIVLALAEGSTAFVMEDGVLYNHDKTRVISCDTEKDGTYVMPNSVTEIADYAFRNSRIENVTVSSNVTDIAYMAFYSCTSLTTVELPSSLKSIGDMAFGECTSLTTINMPEQLESIGERSFMYTSIGQINIPDSVQSLGDDVFTNCNSLTSVILGKGIDTIPNGAFLYNTKLTKVELKNDSVQVGASAFAGCSALKEFDFAHIQGEIGSDAFYGTGLESVTLPNGVTKIVYGFIGSEELSDIDLPESLVHIDRVSFQGTEWYQEQSENMSGTVYLEHVLIESYDTTSSQLIVREGTTAIAENALAWCDNFTEIVLPEGLRVIGASAFEGCSGIERITIPASVEYIGENVFKGCVGLQSITVDPSNPYYKSVDGVLFSKDGTRLLWCPSRIETIYEVPNSVQYISPYAFSCSRVERITIYNSTTVLEDNAIRLDWNDCWMDVTLECYENSVAHEYAKKNLINVETKEQETGWINDGNGWKYVLENGTNVKSGWQLIDGNWYYFINEYRATGWYLLGGAYYYMNPETGIMASNQWIDDTYYVNANGVMVTGWQKIGKDYYYFNANGSKATGIWIGNYYVKADGVMAVSEWIGNYYVDASGAYVATTGWFLLNGSYYYLIGGAKVANQWIGSYYLNADGVMATSQWIGNYYVDASGAYVATTGWFCLNGNYYYLSGGAKVTNQWVGAYYLNADGIMATNQWIGDYYVDATGAYLNITGWLFLEDEFYYFRGGARQKGWFASGSAWYYLDSHTGVMYANEWLNDTYYFYGDGMMATGWVEMSNGVYYYFKASGEKLVNAWVGNYYLGADGVMATNQWIGEYYVGEDGEWIPGYVAPVEPEQPEDPEPPVDPEDPEPPVDPENPDNPDNPENPDNPDNPENPEEPKEPTWGGFF